VEHAVAPLSLAATPTLFISSTTLPTPHVNSKNGAPLDLGTTINALRAIFDLDADDDHTTEQVINTQLSNMEGDLAPHLPTAPPTLYNYFVFDYIGNLKPSCQDEHLPPTASTTKSYFGMRTRRVEKGGVLSHVQYGLHSSVEKTGQPGPKSGHRRRSHLVN
jgi:hypothetical protein